MRVNAVRRTFIGTVLFCRAAAAQTCDWQIHTGAVCAPAGTTVGIGVPSTASGAALEVRGTNSINTVISGNSAVSWPTVSIWFLDFASGGRVFSVGNGGGAGSFAIADQTAGVARLTVDAVGQVGIGTSVPQHLLHVNGTIGAKEVIVSSTGADYVFEPGYRLTPLREVEEFVRANHHLPEIPSAAEVERNGIGVGDMQSKLLAKIEELTLHMIRADERNNRLEQQVGELQERLSKQEGTRQ